MSEHLELVKKLKPCKFNYKDAPPELKIKFDNKTHFGFIAQELNEVFPKEEYNMVHSDDNGYLMINSNELVPILVKCIQELSAKVEELEEKTKNM